jgi:hypothetical protein
MQQYFCGGESGPDEEHPPLWPTSRPVRVCREEKPMRRMKALTAPPCPHHTVNYKGQTYVLTGEE